MPRFRRWVPRRRRYVRKFRFRRAGRRRFGRRRRSNKRVLRGNGITPIPDRGRVVLKWCEQIDALAIPGGTTVPSSLNYALNDINTCRWGTVYAPTTVLQPYAHDLYGQMYQEARVYAAHWNLTVVINEASNTGVDVVVWPCNQSDLIQSFPANKSFVQQLPRAVLKSTNETDRTIIRFSGKVSLPGLAGMTKMQYKTSNDTAEAIGPIQATVPSLYAPTNLQFLQVFIFAENANTPSVKVQARIKYYVELFNQARQPIDT